MKSVFNSVIGLTALVCTAACGSDDGLDAALVIETHTEIVYKTYSDTLSTAQALQTAIDAFVAAPTQTTLTAARNAWLAAREPYGLSEAYRFYDGPIDNPQTGPEGEMNSWPLDEAYVDYVIGNANAGIINNPTAFPTLTKEGLAELNEKGAEANIATGYHAIEFLLWGQDTSTTGPGNRPHTDYLTTGGTAANQERRGQYLELIAGRLVDDLQLVTDAWTPNTANYAADFRALDEREAVRRMLQGMGSLSGAELSGERMATAYDNRDQEDEQSCFSDNTHRDLRANAIAIQNVYYGDYNNVDGAGINEIVRQRDPDLDTKMQQQLWASIEAIEAIPTPFDQALQDDAVGRVKIKAAIDALREQTDTIVEVATLLGITINLE